MAYCRYCGSANPEDSTFCHSCGRALATSTGTVIPSQSAPSSTTNVIMTPAGTTSNTYPAHTVTNEPVVRREDTHIGIGVGHHPYEIMWYAVAGGAVLLLILLLVYWKLYL